MAKGFINIPVQDIRRIKGENWRKMSAYVKKHGKADVLYTRWPPKDAIPLIRKESGKDKQQEKEVK